VNYSRMLNLVVIPAALVLSLQAASITTTVDSLAMPWLWDTVSLNTAFQFGVQDGIGPTMVDSSSGISFAAGGTLTITYLSGLTSAFGGTPVVDGQGYGPNAPSPFEIDANGNLGSSGKPFPSFYMSPYPIYLNTLVATFADSSGNIVGTPFAVFNGPLSVLVPLGATRLQLGINDDIFGDNTGSLQVSVAGPGAGVPEPASFLLMGSAILAAALKYRGRFGMRC
jgi:hypothetical protein